MQMHDILRSKSVIFQTPLTLMPLLSRFHSYVERIVKHDPYLKIVTVFFVIIALLLRVLARG